MADTCDIKGKLSNVICATDGDGDTTTYQPTMPGKSSVWNSILTCNEAVKFGGGKCVGLAS